MFRLTVGAVLGVVMGLFLMPFLVATVIAGQLQQASQLASQWDIPAQVVPALQDAGAHAGVPWFLLAGVASVATDFARHAPDGFSRGDTPGSAIFPVVVPPIGRSDTGAGMLLVRLGAGPTTLLDPQDVRAAADWLAAQMAALSQGSPLAGRPLSDADASRFWEQVVAGAPLAIHAVAAGGADLTPVGPGDNPIRQFGAAVLTRIAAPTTTTNLDAFAAWAAGEGTCARFNPLATTQPEPGAVPFNNLSSGGHVWNYPTFAVGVQATTTALTNGLYQPVLAAFLAGAGVGSVAAAVEASPWGTRHFGSPSYSGAQCRGEPSPVPPPLPTVSGPDAIAATVVARAIRYQAIWAQIAPPTTP